MEFELQAGMKKTADLLVQEENTAKAMGSGSLPVFATPAMAALMEQAASLLTDEAVDAEWTSVGTKLELAHIAATPEGMQVKAEAELLSVDGRKLTFYLQAWDEKELIGKGTHERFLVKRAAFLEKTVKKGQ